MSGVTGAPDTSPWASPRLRCALARVPGTGPSALELPEWSVNPTDPPVPGLQTMSLGLHDVVQCAILGAGFALLAYFCTR